MNAIQIPREPCAERAIVDATTIATFAMATPGRERPVKLIQHPSFRRAPDLGPDPRFTLAGRAPHLLAQIARAA